jgi:hypothetical protein
MDPFVTLYKQGEEKRVWLVDADAWIAQGWSSDPNLTAPVVVEPAPKPELSDDLEKPAPKRRVKAEEGDES